MSVLSAQTIVHHGEDVVFRVLEGEAVLVHLGAGIYFGLDEVGTQVWEWLGERGRLGEVLDEMVATYDVTEEKAREDLTGLVVALLEHELVRIENPLAG